jgi:hypothetical protein
MTGELDKDAKKSHQSTTSSLYLEFAIEAHKSVNRSEKTLEAKREKLRLCMSKLSKSQLNEYVRITDELDNRD